MTERPIMTSGNILRSAVKILFAAGISMLLLWILLGVAGHRPDGLFLQDMTAILSNLPFWALLIYVICSLIQSAFRTQRYRILIQAASSLPDPLPFRPLFFVTLSRNMFVDMLPSRLGEASYLLLIKRVFGTRIANAISSLSLSFAFDLAALAVIIVLAAIASSLSGHASTALFVLSGGLLLIVGIGFTLLFGCWEPSVRLISKLSERLHRFKLIRETLRVLSETGHSIRESGTHGILVRSFLLSLGVRTFKYLALLVLLSSILSTAFAPIPLSHVDDLLLALVAGEASASMPIPTFMSFGSYEMGAAWTLSAFGYTLANATIALFILHLVSQVCDYSLGIMGTLYCIYPKPSEKLLSRLPKQTLAFLAMTTAVLLAILLQSNISLRSALHPAPPSQSVRIEAEGSIPQVTPPDQASIPSFQVVETMELDPSLSQLSGFVVWSTNRTGNHEIVLLDLPSGSLRQLTQHPYKDYYPKISPDGKKVLFSRGTRPDASCRNPQPWDLHLIDLQTGEERRLAANGFEGAWFPDGRSVLFHRGGRQIIRHDLESGQETVLAEAGTHGLPRGIEFQTPSYDASTDSIAVTLRQARRATALLLPTGETRTIAGGCQLTWAPDSKSLFYVEGPGAGDNAIRTMNPETGQHSVLLDAPLPFSHEYFPRMDTTGSWLIFGASAEGHTHDEADYEIFLWKVHNPAEAPLRITRNPANDSWPDIFIHPRS